MLTPASAGAGDPDSQAYARGAWLSRGSLGSQPGVMELISAVVNDLYDGSGVQRLQLSLHKAAYEEWHSQRGAAPRSRRGQQMTSRQSSGEAGGSPGWLCEPLQRCTKGQQLLGDSSATVTALTLLEGAGGRGKLPLHGCSPLSQQLGDTQGNPGVSFGRQARAVASLCVFP